MSLIVFLKLREKKRLETRAVRLVTRVENLVHRESLETGRRVVHLENLVHPGILKSQENLVISRNLVKARMRKLARGMKFQRIKVIIVMGQCNCQWKIANFID